MTTFQLCDLEEPLPLPRSPSRAPQVTPSRCLIHWCFHIPSPEERATAAQGGWQTHGRRRGSLPPARTRSKYVSVILLARRGRTGAGWEGFRQGPVLPRGRTWDPLPNSQSAGTSRRASIFWGCCEFVGRHRIVGDLRNTGTEGTALRLGGSWAAPFKRGQCLSYEYRSLMIERKDPLLQRERPEWDGCSINAQHTGPGPLSPETSLPMILLVPSGSG